MNTLHAGERRLGVPAELSRGRVADDASGEGLGGPGHEQHGAGLPTVAHQLPVRQVPRRPAAERRQDDQRAAHWAAAEPAPLLPLGARQGPRVLRGLPRQGQGVRQAAVRHLLLPRRGAGATQVRSHRLEHPLRLQRVRLLHLRAPAANVHQRVRTGGRGRAG